jgi:hypothetical protein
MVVLLVVENGIVVFHGGESKSKSKSKSRSGGGTL